jgi:hypothetical protein
MFLFPDPPQYAEESVGQPVFLTPLIRAGRIQDARQEVFMSVAVDLEFPFYKQFCTRQKHKNLCQVKISICILKAAKIVNIALSDKASVGWQNACQGIRFGAAQPCPLLLWLHHHQCYRRLQPLLLVLPGRLRQRLRSSGALAPGRSGGDWTLWPTKRTWSVPCRCRSGMTLNLT